MRALLTLLICIPLSANGEEALVAVASNFSPVLEELREVFEATTPHSISIASGSTGKIYAQITNGAPYDIFLAADQERPALLESSGLAVAGSRMTYATGRLALWTADRPLPGENLRDVILQPGIRKLAIANPALAPYGVAAQEVLLALGVWEAVSAKLVLGENVGQAATMVATRNAEAGLVALSSILFVDEDLRRAYRTVPVELHAPIRQDGVLLAHGADNAAAKAFLTFLASDTARDWLVSRGYGKD
jgi:molybdate transport system substrate-binding protein